MCLLFGSKIVLHLKIEISVKTFSAEKELHQIDSMVAQIFRSIEMSCETTPKTAGTWRQFLWMIFWAGRKVRAYSKVCALPMLGLALLAPSWRQGMKFMPSPCLNYCPIVYLSTLSIPNFCKHSRRVIRTDKKAEQCKKIMCSNVVH
jgi:hypothetical protein